jgi:hypothetical protein
MNRFKCDEPTFVDVGQSVGMNGHIFCDLFIICDLLPGPELLRCVAVRVCLPLTLWVGFYSAGRLQQDPTREIIWDSFALLRPGLQNGAVKKFGSCFRFL